MDIHDLFDRKCCKCFEIVQDIEAVTKKHSQKRISRSSSESAKDDGPNVSRARGNTLRGKNGNVSFIVIILKPETFATFSDHTCYRVTPPRT